MARTAGAVLSRARVHTAALGLAALVVTALMAVPISVASARHGRPTTGGANQLLRRFPVGTRRLCCTTSGSNAVTRPSRRSSNAVTRPSRPASSAGPTVPAGSSAGARSGHVLSTVGLVAVAIALLVVGLDIVVARARRSRRRRPGKSRTATAAGDAAHQLVVRNDARKRASQAEEPQPIDEPPDRPEAAPATATNGRVTARKHVLLDRADDRTPRRPGDARAAAEEFDLGLELHRRGQLESAALAYRRAEERGMPEAAFNLGVLLYESGDLARAEATWRRCLEYEHARAATNLGFLLEQRGDVRTALKAYAVGERWGDPEAGRLGAALLQRAGGLPPPARGSG
jgi:hypothetical protein